MQGLTLSPDRPLLLPLPPGEPFDAKHTFRCGQIFRWRLHGDTWYGPHGRGALAVRPVPEGLEVRAMGAGIDATEAWRFLGLDRSLLEVRERLAGDRHLSAAFAAVEGLRIVRQDPWDCIACFICSQWNNVPKIELSTERIARRWGTVYRWPEGVEVAALPAPEVLAACEPDDLRESALGYRCGYLVQTARLAAAGAVDPEGLRTGSYEHALLELLRLPGIGRKVADCILLFALDKPQACPIDVWVRRVMHELYSRSVERYLPDLRQRSEKGLSNLEYEAMVRFARDRWGMLAGYAQQYLFHARRLGRLGTGINRRDAEGAENGQD